MSFVHATLVLLTFVHISNISTNFNETFWLLNPIYGRSKFFWTTHRSVRRKLLGSKIIWTQNYFGPKILGSNIFGAKLFWIKNSNFLHSYFLTQNFLDQNCFWPYIFGVKTFWTHKFFGQKISLHQIFLTYCADVHDLT